MNENQRKVKTISGIKWSMLNQVIVQVSNLLIGILLTRLLTPDDFGLIAMVTVFTGFLAVFQDFGLGAYLIYKKEVSDKDYSTIFYTHFIIGIILAVLIFFFSGFIASFYDRKILKIITTVIAISFVIEPLNYVQLTILRKKLDFKSLFFVNSIGVIISGAIAIYMAYQGYGVWSIVVKLLLLSIIKTILLWIISNWKPRLLFSLSSLKEALKYSLPIVGNKSIGYFMRNTDNLIIGKLLGSVALGIYSRAYSLMMLPINQIGGVISGVFFASFSLIKDNIPVFRSNWLKINGYLAFILFPISTLIFIMAEAFVKSILGEQWIETIPIIRILSIAGAAQGMSFVSYVYNALGDTKLSFRISIFTSSILVLAIVIGVQYNISGIAYAYTIATLLLFPTVYWYFIAKKLKIPFLSIYLRILKFLFSSIIAGSLVSYFFNSFQTDFLIQLIVKPILFLVLYLTILKIFRDKTFFEIKTLILNNYH